MQSKKHLTEIRIARPAGINIAGKLAHKYTANCTGRDFYTWNGLTELLAG